MNFQKKEKRKKDFSPALIAGGGALGLLGVGLESSADKYIKPKENVEKAQKYLEKTLERYSLGSEKELKPKAKELEEAIRKNKEAKDLSPFEKSFASMYEGSLEQINKAIRASDYIETNKKGLFYKTTGKSLKYAGALSALVGSAKFISNRNKKTSEG